MIDVVRGRDYHARRNEKPERMISREYVISKPVEQLIDKRYSHPFSRYQSIVILKPESISYFGR